MQESLTDKEPLTGYTDESTIAYVPCGENGHAGPHNPNVLLELRTARMHPII